MDGTEGVVRGMQVTDTGMPIKMPIGDDIKGRLFNVVGHAIDGLKQPKGEKGLPIHRSAPAYEDLSTSSEVLFTGIKVIDLIEPFGVDLAQRWADPYGERQREFCSAVSHHQGGLRI
jgi:F-type H+-transporting ATPase subunit beta